tara:strand:+ start:60 stop:707 length:648 start_codon:yes stop_codon:yes gene_type:complete
MKTYISDIIPKVQKFSKKLDDLTLLTEKSWVVIDDQSNAKTVYIFRKDHELLIALNGKVEKAKWDYVGNNSLLIDRKDESYLFKHGFIDSNLLALKIDSKNEYAFLVNENKYTGELNSIESIFRFLEKEYLKPPPQVKPKPKPPAPPPKKVIEFKDKRINTDKGALIITSRLDIGFTAGDTVRLNDKAAPDGKYAYSWPKCWFYIVVKDGKVYKH